MCITISTAENLASMRKRTDGLAESRWPIPRYDELVLLPPPLWADIHLKKLSTVHISKLPKFLILNRPFAQYTCAKNVLKRFDFLTKAGDPNFFFDDI